MGRHAALVILSTILIPAAPARVRAGTPSSTSNSSTSNFRRAAAADSTCDGQQIDAIDIAPGRPPFEGSARKWQAVARAFGLHHATTRADVVRTYLLLHEGDACNERRRTESERVLRALPFLADAAIRAIPADSGHVRLEVTTTDEIPALVSGAWRGAGPSALGLGNQNVDGLGLRAVLGAERGYVYRNGAHAQLIDYALFDEPATVGVDAARDPLGSHVLLSASHLFLTDLQRGSWLGSFRGADEFPIVLQPDGATAHVDETVEVHEEQWSLGGLLRSEVHHTVLLFGGVALGNRVSPTGMPFFVTDSGLVANGDSALRNRYIGFHSARLGGLVGVRRVRYRTVDGLDALFASQDVMTGVQIGGLAAPGVTSGVVGRAGHDLFIAGSGYAGLAPGRVFAAADAESEIRRDFSTGDWDSMVSDVHGGFYYRLARGQLLRFDDRFSMLSHTRIPEQLTLNDPIGGLLGYAGSALAGARRNVARAEYRWARPAAVKNADVGAALFVESGALWAGDAPYGVSARRESIGFSILASYPTRSKGLYRLDFAVPLERTGAPALEVRFTSGHPTAALSIEPNDVSLARLGPVPATLFAWPAR